MCVSITADRVAMSSSDLEFRSLVDKYCMESHNFKLIRNLKVIKDNFWKQMKNIGTEFQRANKNRLCLKQSSSY